MLIGDFLRDSANRAPHRVALISGARRLTYRQFDDEANRLAGALLDLKLKQGAKLAILSTNSPEYAIAYFAIARTAYVSAHCSTRSAASELASMLNKIEAEVLFLESRFTPLLETVLPQLDQPLKLILLDRPDSEETRLPGAIHVKELVSDRPACAPAVVLHETDALAITLTGGTTGLPKAVLVSHKARCASSVAAARDFGLDEEDIVLVSTPLFHAAGLFVWFGTAVMLGTSIVLQEAWDPVRFTLLVRKERISAAFLVPSQISDLISHTDFSATHLKTLRHIGYAGAPMRRVLSEHMRAALPHITFTENYGQSEFCPITIRREGHGVSKRETVGRAALNVELGITDQDANLLPPGEIGDIVVRGEPMFEEYFHSPEETANAFSLPGGWLQTGDVGYLDDDGFLTLLDRSKDMLVSGGENVYPAEIENALDRHEAVVECAVFGIPDDRWGEVPAAHVVLVPEATVSEVELRHFCTLQIDRFKRPRVIKFVDSLPRTAVGKIDKNDLRSPYWTGHKKKI